MFLMMRGLPCSMAGLLSLPPGFRQPGSRPQAESAHAAHFNLAVSEQIATVATSSMGQAEQHGDPANHLAARHRHVLVLGDYRQTVTIVRSLGRIGFWITLGTSDGRSSTALSRFVSEVRVFQESDRDRFLDQLEDYLRRDKPDYVFPVGEDQARCIARATERFMPLATWVMPDPDTLLRCLDKRALRADPDARHPDRSVEKIHRYRRLVASRA